LIEESQVKKEKELLEIEAREREQAKKTIRENDSKKGGVVSDG